jgi:hypothetical protein
MIIRKNYSRRITYPRIKNSKTSIKNWNRSTCQVSSVYLCLEIFDLNKYEEEIMKENERLTFEKEFKNLKTEDLFQSDIFQTIVKYSKDIHDYNKPKLATVVDVSIYELTI